MVVSELIDNFEGEISRQLGNDASHMNTGCQILGGNDPAPI
jgi:hypothetical protein